MYHRLTKLNDNIKLVDGYLRTKTEVPSNMIGLYSSIFGAYLSLKYNFDINEQSISEIREYIALIESDNKHIDNEKINRQNFTRRII